jgi:hypothetical protein
MSYVTDLPSSAKIYFRDGHNPRGDRTGSGDKLTWVVPEADLTLFLKALTGLPETFTLPGTPPVSISRIVPLRSPYFPNVLADQFDCKSAGFRSASERATAALLTGQAWWSTYFVTVIFKTPQYQVDGSEPFMTVESDPSGRTDPVTASGMQFPDASHPTFDPGLWLPGENYRITLVGVPVPSRSIYLTYYGSVNSATWRGFPRGTVRYMAPSIRTTTTIGNVQSSTVCHHFETSTVDWNLAYKSDGTTGNLTVAGIVNPRYAYKDFATLLL